MFVLLSGCATYKTLPEPIATVDIYKTKDGFYIITDGKQSIHYRFNVNQVIRTNKTNQE